MQRTLSGLVVVAAICLPAAAALAYDAGGGAAFPVLKAAAYPGDIISEEMIVLMPAGHRSQPGGIVTGMESVVGKMARRTLLPGQPIPQNALRAPFVIQQGKTVSLIFQSGNISITGIAVALESGSAGEIISARNPDSGMTVHGVVQADGSLRTQ
jgi:flagellar basal body P-ring formation protein FlgA